MKIGIVGSGNLGTAIGRRLASKGHEIVIAFARTPEKVAQAAETIGSGAKAGSLEDAVRHGEVVVVATPWAATLDVVRQIAPHSRGKIIWDTTNPLKTDMSGLEVGTTTSGGEQVAIELPGVRTVKAIAPFAELLHSRSTAIGSHRPEVYVCSDDAEAGATIANLVADLDATALHVGPLSLSRYTEPLGMFLVQLAYVQGMGPRIGSMIIRDTP